MIIRAHDFETTGIPSEADKHAIVEIGCCDVEVRDDGFIWVDSPRATLCNPGRPIPHEAMAVHHITDAEAAEATGDLSFIGEADFYAAHNAEYEAQFWTPAKPLICTWKVALRLWPDAPSHSLQFLRYHLGLKTVEIFADRPHRAGPDAYVCALLIERILQNKRCTVDDMVRWSSGPAFLPRCPLTKHRGKKWEDVPSDYLDFIVNKSNGLDRHVIATAKHWLKQREAA